MVLELVPVDMQDNLRGNDGEGNPIHFYLFILSLGLGKPRSFPLEGCLLDMPNVLGVTTLQGSPEE